MVGFVHVQGEESGTPVKGDEVTKPRDAQGTGWFPYLAVPLAAQSTGIDSPSHGHSRA